MAAGRPSAWAPLVGLAGAALGCAWVMRRARHLAGPPEILSLWLLTGVLLALLGAMALRGLVRMPSSGRLIPGLGLLMVPATQTPIGFSTMPFGQVLVFCGALWVTGLAGLFCGLAAPRLLARLLWPLGLLMGWLVAACASVTLLLLSAGVAGLLVAGLAAYGLAGFGPRRLGMPVGLRQPLLVAGSWLHLAALAVLFTQPG